MIEISRRFSLLSDSVGPGLSETRPELVIVDNLLSTIFRIYQQLIYRIAIFHLIIVIFSNASESFRMPIGIKNLVLDIKYKEVELKSRQYAKHTGNI